jgi:hypothetical protein
VGCEGLTLYGIGKLHRDDQRITGLIINEPGGLAAVAIEPFPYRSHLSGKIRIFHSAITVLIRLSLWNSRR